MVKLENDWDELLKGEFEKPYYIQLREFLKNEYSKYKVYPDMNNIFNALKYCSYEDVKIVILGQDPYHGEGQAHGLAFSVMQGVEQPPSLQNIFKELKDDLGYELPNSGCLTPWTAQGVLLLNAVLTVRRGEANSHRGKGWELFTDRVIKILNGRDKPIVFMLWGRNAMEKESIITNKNHFILSAPHPSPLSAYSGFMGCRHFSKANEFLTRSGQLPINWGL